MIRQINQKVGVLLGVYLLLFTGNKRVLTIGGSVDGPLHDLISIAQDFYLSCGVFQKWIKSDLIFDY